jgi:predicted transcriptional regulator
MLFTQEINVKKETFGKVHQALQEKIMKPIKKVKTRSEQDSKQPKDRSINTQNSGDLNVYQRDQLSPRDILAAHDSMIFRCRFGDLNDL